MSSTFIGVGILIFEFCMVFILLQIEKYHETKHLKKIETEIVEKIEETINKEESQ